MIEISSELKNFIDDHPEEINNCEFRSLYNALSLGEGFNRKDIGDFTNLFYKIGVNPMKYLDIIPYGFLFGQDVVNLGIPLTIKEIGEYAFSGCYNLEKVIIPKSVEFIYPWAFSQCIGLTEVVIPKSVVKIGYNVFKGCINLKTIYCEAEVQPRSWNTSWSAGCSAKVVWGYKKPIPQIPISESFLDPEEKFWDYRTQGVDGEDVFDITRSESGYGQDYIDNLNKEYNNKISTLEQLTPKEYFEACAKGFGKSVESQMRQISNDSEVIDHLKEVIQKYHKKFPLTYLDYSDHDFDQEGRHRMYTVGELFGWDKKFPVMIIKDVEGKALNLTIKRNRPTVSHHQERYVLEDENRGALLYGDSQYDMLLKLQDMKEDLDKRVFSFLWNFIKDNKSSFR